MFFRFKILLLFSLVLFLCIFSINYFFVKSEYEKYRKTEEFKKINLVKNSALIIRESYLKGNFLDIKNYLKLIKKTNLNIFYINVFDRYGNLVSSTYSSNKNLKINYSFSNKILEDFYFYKKININDKFKEKNLLYKDLFLINENQLIDEYTYFFTLDGEIISSIKIGFFHEKKLRDDIFYKNFAILELLVKNRIFKFSMYIFLFGIIAVFFITYKVNSFIFIFKQAIKLLSEEKFDTRINFEYEGEIKDLVNEFNMLAKRLKEIDVLKQDFISNVTHELRSPLGAIESYLNFMIEEDIELGLDKKDFDYEGINIKERHEYLARMRNNTQRLRVFINNILDIAKIENGGFVLNKEMAKLSEIIEDVRNLFLIKAKEKNLLIETEIDDLVDEVYLDIDKIKQLFIILMDNAMKFSFNAGEIKIKVSFLYNGERLKDNVHSILIKFIDTGIGIADENIEKIFDKFEQVKSISKDFAQSEKGTGLGLSIAKGIVELHNGTIWVESIFGKGSTFFIKLPAIFIK